MTQNETEHDNELSMSNMNEEHTTDGKRARIGAKLPVLLAVVSLALVAVFEPSHSPEVLYGAIFGLMAGWGISQA